MPEHAQKDKGQIITDTKRKKESINTNIVASNPQVDGNRQNKTDNTSVSHIANKIRRKEIYLKLKKEKKKEKRKRQDERKRVADALGDQAPPKLVPKTIDSMREYDETTVVQARSVSVNADETLQECNLKEELNKEPTKLIERPDNEEDEEVNWDLSNDELKGYFNKTYEPKVLITSADNLHSKTISFIKEMTRIVPNCSPFWRKNSSIKKMVKQAIANKYTDIIVVNEDNRTPNGMLISHLPDGPTAHFKLSNVKVSTMIKRNFREISTHRPEVILNGFTTRLGHTVARMLAALFHYEPQFHGKRSVTFHCQRDYIFFRHHR